MKSNPDITIPHDFLIPAVVRFFPDDTGIMDLKD